MYGYTIHTLAGQSIPDPRLDPAMHTSARPKKSIPKLKAKAKQRSATARLLAEENPPPIVIEIENDSDPEPALPAHDSDDGKSSDESTLATPRPAPGASSKRRKRDDDLGDGHLEVADAPVLEILPVTDNEGHRHIVRTVLPVLRNVMLSDQHCRKPPRLQVDVALRELDSAGQRFWGVHQIYAARKTVISIVTSHYYDSTRALLC